VRLISFSLAIRTYQMFGIYPALCLAWGWLYRWGQRSTGSRSYAKHDRRCGCGIRELSWSKSFARYQVQKCYRQPGSREDRGLDGHGIVYLSKRRVSLTSVRLTTHADFGLRAVGIRDGYGATTPSHVDGAGMRLCARTMPGVCGLGVESTPRALRYFERPIDDRDNLVLQREL